MVRSACINIALLPSVVCMATHDHCWTNEVTNEVSLSPPDLQFEESYVSTDGTTFLQEDIEQPDAVVEDTPTHDNAVTYVNCVPKEETLVEGNIYAPAYKDFQSFPCLIYLSSCFSFIFSLISTKLPNSNCIVHGQEPKTSTTSELQSALIQVGQWG